LAVDIGLQRGDLSLRALVNAARPLSWTRDPFDRLIVAEVIVAGGSLVSKDQKILAHCAQAVW
jgi:PIN domain nuclease of toxin-antitoxin system